MDRTATAWRALLPVEMDAHGWSDAECWIEIGSEAVTGVIWRNEGEDNESTLRIIHRTNGSEWNVDLELSSVWDGPHSDILAMTAEPHAARTYVGSLGWNIDDHVPLDVRMDGDEIVIRLPREVLARIDMAIDENEKRS